MERGTEGVPEAPPVGAHARATHVQPLCVVRVKAEPLGERDCARFRRRSIGPRCAADRRSRARKSLTGKLQARVGKVAKLKREVTVKKEVKVKQDVKVKQEPLEKATSKHWDPIQHFTHQVAVVQQFIPLPKKWERFLGNLGTGILGARPEGEETAKRGFVFLFLNAGAARLQAWNGRSMSGFAPSLDRCQKVLRWESQRSDKTGRVISQIIEHVRAGAEVVVAVRSSPGEGFQILGRTREFWQDSEARFLLEPGDHLVGERGSARMHKYITAQCIDAGLKAGIGLIPYQYPLPRRPEKPQFCSACCWQPATAMLRFSSLGEKAADILDAKASAHANSKDDTQKAASGKQAVKRERSDEIVPELPLAVKVKVERDTGSTPGKQDVKRHRSDEIVPELPLAAKVKVERDAGSAPGKQDVKRHRSDEIVLELPLAVKVKVERDDGDNAKTGLAKAPRVRRRWPADVIVIPDDMQHSASHDVKQQCCLKEETAHTSSDEIARNGKTKEEVVHFPRFAAPSAKGASDENSTGASRLDMNACVQKCAVGETSADCDEGCFKKISGVLLPCISSAAEPVGDPAALFKGSQDASLLVEQRKVPEAMSSEIQSEHVFIGGSPESAGGKKQPRKPESRAFPHFVLRLLSQA